MPSRDGAPSPALARAGPGIARARRALGVRLRIANAATMRVRLELHDHHPPSFEAEGLPRRLELRALAVDRGRLPGAAGGARRDRVRRGNTPAFSPRPLVEIEVPSEQGPRVPQLPRAREVHAARHRQPAVADRRAAGAPARRGTEFHQLREYRQGDSQRAIDWKATSRTAPHLARVRGGERPARAARGRLRPPHGFERRRAFAFRPRAERRAAPRARRCARATRSAS